MIYGDDAQLQDMTPWRKTIQSAGLALKHAHQIAVNVSMHMVAAFSFRQAELYSHSVAGNHVLVFRR